jgi:dTMP kinase
VTARGRFITLEGGEGAGKSTQLRRLAEALRGRGHAVVETREPGGAPAAERIRTLLVEGGTESWDGMTEALLHFAARREHLLATVWPALDSGSWVICDRFADSTLAYQGYGHGVDRAFLGTLQAAVIGDFRPDLTLILDLPVEEGLKRAHGRGGFEDRYERMGIEFHRRLRAGFLEIARAEPERCVVVDAARPVDKVAGAILAAVRDRLADS